MKNELVPMEAPPPLLAMHIAEYEASNNPLWTMEEIAEHFGITVQDIEHYKTLPTFRAEVRASLETLKDSHAHIRHKAQAQLETYIDTVIPPIMGDPNVNAGDKLKYLQFLATTARVNNDPLEKAKAETATAKPVTSGATLNLFLTTSPGAQSIPIDITSVAQPVPIDVTPEKIDNE